MKKMDLFKLLWSICILLAVIGAPLTAIGGEKDVIKITYAWNDFGPKFRASTALGPGGELQRMLYTRSGGRIELKIIPRMFGYTDVLNAVAQGKADMGDVPMAWMSGSYPLWDWGEIPGIVNHDPVIGLAEENAVYQDPKVLEIYEKSMREIGLVFGFVAQWDPANIIWSSKPITKLENLKGLKMRVGGFLPTIGLKAMGASVVTIASGEIAPAMFSGAIDAALAALGWGYTIGLAKASKFIVQVPLSPTWPEVVVINAKKWDSIPPDLQKVIKDVGRELQQMITLSTTAEYIMTSDAVELSGVKRLRFEPDELKKAFELVKPIRDEWLKISGPYAPELLAAVEDAVSRYRAFPLK